MHILNVLRVVLFENLTKLNKFDPLHRLSPNSLKTQSPFTVKMANQSKLNSGPEINQSQLNEHC